MTDIIRVLAEKCGFEEITPLDPSTFEYFPQAAEYCKSCEMYGKKWSCPPYCMDLNAMRDRVASFSNGFLFQTIGTVTSVSDRESVHLLMKTHLDRFHMLVRSIRGKDIPCFPLAAGSCSLCPECTCPDAPCRYPDQMIPSMEAFGLNVREICAKNGTSLVLDEHRLSFCAAILF